MTKLWLNDGKIVTDAGNVVLCDTCPCTGTASLGLCSICIGDTPWQVSVVIPVLANTGNCSDCSNFAGTYVLTESSECTWDGTFANPTTCNVSSQDILLTFNLQDTGVDVLMGLVMQYTGGTLIARWYRTYSSVDQIDCNFNNTVISAYDGFYCDNTGADALVSAV